MCLGWAWGCAATAAAISVRDQALLARQMQEVQASYVSPYYARFYSDLEEGSSMACQLKCNYGWPYSKENFSILGMSPA